MPCNLVPKMCFMETFCLHLQVRRNVLLDVHGVTDQNTAVLTLTAVRRSRHLPEVVTSVGEKQMSAEYFSNSVSQYIPFAHRFLTGHKPPQNTGNFMYSSAPV